MQLVVTSAGNAIEHGGFPALLAPDATKRAAFPNGSFRPDTSVPIAESETARVNEFAVGKVAIKYTVSSSTPPHMLPPNTTGSPIFIVSHKKFAVNVVPDLDNTMTFGQEFFLKVKTDPVFTAEALPTVYLAPTTIVSPKIEMSDPNRAYWLVETKGYVSFWRNTHSD